jgi:hypothetical protein
VDAGRLHARSAGLDDGDGDGLGVAPLHLRDPRADDVAGKRAVHEDDEAVQTADAAAAVGERVDPDVDLLVRLDGGGHPESLAA